MNGTSKTPCPYNEPIKSYIDNSPEKVAIKKELEKQSKNPVKIPLIIGGKEFFEGDTTEIRAPHNNNLKLGEYHKATKEHISMAISSALSAREEWSKLSLDDRAAVFLKAADLLAGPYRNILNAATMLGQSKNIFQAEIDSACELIDFWRFNPYFAKEIYAKQPELNSQACWNRVEYRALEGFVFAVTPFNFTSIAGNLPTAPALMGNVCIWKPASSSVLSAYYIMKILKEAGLPDGVINMVPGKGGDVGNPVLDNPNFSGLHFTGSTSTFNMMWKKIGENLHKGIYKTYPRIVGETGGKDYVFAYKDADINALNVALIRGAFEYQGQKCSAASRAYVPKSIWPKVLESMKKMINEFTVGDPMDFRNFMCAVIDKPAFNTITGYIEYAKKANDAEIVAGGKYDSTKGYFIDPTIIQTSNPKFKTMCEEIFGPVLTIYVYEDNKVKETLDLLDETSPYALTGAIFAQDRGIIKYISERLVNTSGNFYINDKPTGAVVGQQPFGGARASGTNDKAGSYLNLLRWISARTIKENFNPPHDYKYPHMDSK